MYFNNPTLAATRLVQHLTSKLATRCVDIVTAGFTGRGNHTSPHQ
jgi:hypothetical protein